MGSAAETLPGGGAGPSWALARAHRVHGIARLRYERRGASTRLIDLYHRDPMRFLFPHVSGDEASTAVLVTTSGGLVGGDRLCIGVEIGEWADTLVLTQAAEKVYGSGGPDCTVDGRFRVGPKGCLEWLPQETILFQNARLRRSTCIDVAAGGRFLGGEILVFGRSSRGESFTRGLLRERWDVRREGQLRWVDALRLEEESLSALSATAGLAGARAYAMMVYAADDAGAWLDVARDLRPTDPQIRCAATVVREVLVIRWLASDAFLLRRAYGRFWAAFRSAAFGRPERLPRLWDI